MRDKSKQQYKNMWLTIPDQARIALLILLALSSKALEIYIASGKDSLVSANRIATLKAEGRL